MTTSKTRSFCNPGTASQNTVNSVTLFLMSKEKRANAVTASSGQSFCRPATVMQKGGSDMTTFDFHVNLAKFTAQWQSKMFYSYHTDDQYDVEEASISDMSDSDENDPLYGNHKEVNIDRTDLRLKTFQSGRLLWLPW